MKDGIRVLLGALGGAVLTLALIGVFSGSPMMNGTPMLNSGMGQMMSSGMMGGGMMNSGMTGGAAMLVMLLVGAAVLFAWVLGLAAVVGLAIWGVRRLSARGGLW
jgi:hypothetical protein